MAEREPVGDAGIVLIGPGAIGGAVAGAIFESGHEVIMAARSPFDRLEVTHPSGRLETPVRCLTDPAALGPTPVVLVGVKAHQTEGAAPWLEAAVGPDSTVVVLQNGVEHRARFTPLVPPSARVVPVVVDLPAIRSEPGRIAVSTSGRLTVPDDAGGRRLAELIDVDWMRVRLTDDWTTAGWIKLMLNAASGAMGTVTRKRNNVLTKDDEATAITLAIMKEVAAVARAEGADLPDELAERVLANVVERAGGHTSSILADRLAGLPTEWEARNAVVVRTAERHGIDVPLNRLFTTLIRLGEPEPDPET